MIIRFLQIALILVVLIGLGVIAIMIWARTAPRPTNLGVTNGQLVPCPATPNCVTTQAGQPDQRMQPLSYTSAPEAAQERLLQVVQSLPRTQVIENRPGYVAFEFRSAFFGFIDDVEFLFDTENNQIHFRSASRLGGSDMGVNRIRMEQISRAFSTNA